MIAEALTGLLRRDRAIVVSGLVAATLIAWVYLLLGAGMDMAAMPGATATPNAAAVPPAATMAGMMAMQAWTPEYAVIVFVMWTVMMVAMMLPSAAPTILLVASLARRRGAGTSGLVAGAAGLFATGYLLVWTAFSLLATALQWAMSQAGMLSPMMATTDRVLAAAVLIAAGIYQWTPWKDACLRHCRSPLAVVLGHWRPGRFGPLRSGLANGAFCLGCCWVLMALLFVGGVMNFAWIAGLTLFVLIEKTLPWGGWTARIAGAVLVVWGGLSLAPLL